MSPTTSSRRRGYREINHEEDIPSHTEPLTAAEDAELLDAEVTEFVEPEGLDALTWSFLASGVMTVSDSYKINLTFMVDAEAWSASLPHISFLPYFLSLCLVIISRGNGSGRSHLVFHT